MSVCYFRPNLKSIGKEDIEQSILFYLKDKGILRFNDITFRTIYNDPGGLGTNLYQMNKKAQEYLCKNYDLKRLSPYVRMVDCADNFSTPLPKIKEALQRLSLMNIDYKPLITHKNFTYFDMPRYKYFLESIKFRKNYTRMGWNKLRQNVSSYQNGAYDD